MYQAPRLSDVTYPSFSQVLAQADSDTMRLPAYRSSYAARHHPYPRPAPRRYNDDLMETVDYRYLEEQLDVPPLVPRVRLVVTDEDLANLEAALRDDTLSPVERRRRSLSILMVVRLLQTWLLLQDVDASASSR